MAADAEELRPDLLVHSDGDRGRPAATAYKAFGLTRDHVAARARRLLGR